MTWNSHKILTATSVYVATNNIVFAIIAGMGSIFPDKIEYYIFNRQHWSKYHRTWTHFWGFYAVIAGLSFLFLHQTSLLINSFEKLHYVIKVFPIEYYFFIIGLNAAIWYCIGCLAHILEDVLCGGIPLLVPWKKIQMLHLFYVSSPEEYYFSYGLSIFLLIIKFRSFIPMIHNFFVNFKEFIS